MEHFGAKTGIFQGSRSGKVREKVCIHGVDGSDPFLQQIFQVVFQIRPESEIVETTTAFALDSANVR